jgi:hypothetical protein
MESETKLALFVGDNADGFTQEITKIEPELNWYGNSYISRRSLETKTLGTVQVYVLATMSIEEEILRMKIIRRAL